MTRCGHGDFRLADVVYEQRKKPVWRSVDFSVAHAEGIVTVAIARHALVGVDVEPEGAVTPRIVGRLMSPSARYLPPIDVANATARWTQVEAIVKAAGKGVWHAVDIEWQTECARLHGQEWWCRNLDVGLGHVAHVAVDDSRVTIETIRVSEL